MKLFNITAQVYDLNSDSPKQSLLINEVVESTNFTSAEDIFRLAMISKKIDIQKILSIKEINEQYLNSSFV
jgi:hypothetical protein